MAEEIEITTLDMINEMYDTFIGAISVDGEASIKDIFYNGMLAAVILLNDKLETDGEESLVGMIDEIDAIISEKNTEGEVDTSYLLHDSLEDDEDYDEEQFEDEDGEESDEEDDEASFEEEE